jgi:hypothetical protein
LAAAARLPWLLTVSDGPEASVSSRGIIPDSGDIRRSDPRFSAAAPTGARDRSVTGRLTVRDQGGLQ